MQLKLCLLYTYSELVSPPIVSIYVQAAQCMRQKVTSSTQTSTDLQVCQASLCVDTSNEFPLKIVQMMINKLEI